MPGKSVPKKSKAPAKILFLLFLLSVMVFFVLSCETGPPEITQFFWQINLVAGTTGDAVHESISLFASVADEEGIDDIEKMVIFSDVNQLYWEIPFSELERKEKDNTKWYGTNALVMPGYESFPVGEYTVRISDYAGHIAEKKLFLAASKNPEDPVSLPSLDISGNTITCHSTRENPQLWIYSSADELLEIAELSGSSFDLNNISSSRDAAYIKVYVYDKKLGVGIIRGDYYIQR